MKTILFCGMNPEAAAKTPLLVRARITGTAMTKHAEVSMGTDQFGSESLIA